MIIQEHINGIEYASGCLYRYYFKRWLHFVKEKIKCELARQINQFQKDVKLFNLIKEFVKKSRLKGIIDIDIFKVNEEYYISEVNPRFGGGYPHAYECGVNVPKMIINNLLDKENQECIGQYENDVFMMKFNEVKIIKK